MSDKSKAAARRRNPGALRGLDVKDVPFVRVPPKKIQASLGRDALVALGEPHSVRWDEFTDGSGSYVTLRAVGEDEAQEHANEVRVTYRGERASAIITIPVQLREALVPGRYWAMNWEKNNWLVIAPKKPWVRPVTGQKEATK